MALAGWISSTHAATIVVTDLGDSGAGTLREALASATDGDTIGATGVSGTILLTSGELVVSNSVTIVGPGPANLAVDGNAASGVFNIYPGLTVTISGLTITNGAAIWGGGIYNDHSTLTLSNCTVTGNASVIGGGIYNAGSGGTATLRIIASRVEGNAAVGLAGAVPLPGQGGGLYNAGDGGSAVIEIIRSDITGNAAKDSGGGLYNYGAFGSAPLTVIGSTLSDNLAREGGAIVNAHATLTVSNCVFTGNVATNGNGGAILNDGKFPGSATLTVIGSSISNNVVRNRNNGGGICNDGSNPGGSATLTVIASTISSNSIPSFGYGAGLFNVGDDAGNATMTVIASSVSKNSCSRGGGGIANQTESGSVTLTLSNCTLTANSPQEGTGGGILNTAGDSGTATVMVVASTLSSNGIGQRGSEPFIETVIANYGGGIYNSAGSNSLALVTVLASTLNGNMARDAGGIYNSGDGYGKATLMVHNSTISGNSAESRGGGIYNQGDFDFDTKTAITSGVTVVLNSTFSDNSASQGGAIHNFLGKVEIGSSILMYGDQGFNIENSSFVQPTYTRRGTINSLGFNVINDFSLRDAGFLFFGPDQNNTDPVLGPLQNNGGPTLTHALLPSSPAIDWGTNFLASATDQRGFARTVDNPGITNALGRGDGTDAGAFELQNFGPVVLCSNVTVVAGAGCAANASINAGTYDPDAGDTFTLSQSPAGPYPVGQTLVTLTAVDNHGYSNSCQSIVTVTPVADVGIAKAVVNGQGKPGQALIYTLTVRDFGPCSASGVTVNDVVPSGTTFVSASPTPSSAPPAGSVGTVTWNLGTMSSGGLTNLTLTVKVSAKGNPQIVNTATVTSTSSDPNSANNSATVTTTRKAK